MARSTAARRRAVSTDSIGPPRPGQGIGGEGGGLPGCRGPFAPAPDGLCHHRVAGWVVALLHAGGGVEVGDGGSGLLAGGDGPAPAALDTVLYLQFPRRFRRAGLTRPALSVGTGEIIHEQDGLGITGVPSEPVLPPPAKCLRGCPGNDGRVNVKRERPRGMGPDVPGRTTPRSGDLVTDACRALSRSVTKRCDGSRTSDSRSKLPDMSARAAQQIFLPLSSPNPNSNCSDLVRRMWRSPPPG